MKMFYLMKRVLKTKKNDYTTTFFKIFKGTIFISVISLFFQFKAVFTSAKLNEVELQQNSPNDFPKVDTSEELIWILALFEKLFLVLGVSVLLFSIVYFLITVQRNFLLSKEKILIKKLNGGDNLSLALEFSIEQLLEVLGSLFLGTLIAGLLVNHLVLRLNHFWLFEGLSYSSLVLLSPTNVFKIVLGYVLLFSGVFWLLVKRVSRLKD